MEQRKPAPTIPPQLQHFIAGSASGVALVLAGHPFDTIKVRLQTEGMQGRFQGPIHCLMGTLKTEGIRGLYKGATPPMVATGFINSALFGMMGMCKEYVQGDNKVPTIPQVMFCGMTTGWVVSIIVTPIEQIKSRLQIQYALPSGVKPLYSGPLDCARQLVKNNGIRGLYIGWFATVLHRGQNWSYFGAYEAARRYLAPNSEGKLSPLASICAGACAGTSFWLSCYPLDVVKSRFQSAPDTKPPKYRGLIHCAKTIYQQEGWRAFF